MNGVAAYTVYNEALVANPSVGQQITAIQADIAVPPGYTRTGNAVASAYLLMEFQPGADRGTQNHLLRAMAGYTDDGTVSPGAMFMLMKCDAGTCLGPPGGVSGTWPIGPNLPMALGSACTFGISVNTATEVFTFTMGGGIGCNGGTAVSAAVDASGWSLPFPVDVSSTNALASYLMAQIRCGATGGGNGAITASYDNVSVGYNNGAASAFDNFNTGTLDPAKWMVRQ